MSRDRRINWKGALLVGLTAGVMSIINNHLNVNVWLSMLIIGVPVFLAGLIASFIFKPSTKH